MQTEHPTDAPQALTHLHSVRPPGRWLEAWRRLGGGSLTLSLAIHAMMLTLAGALVITSQVMQQQVDFLPGSDTKAGAEASAELQHQIKAKNQRSISKSMPMTRIVSSGPSVVSLPDIPVDPLEVPDVGEVLNSGALGSRCLRAATGGDGFNIGRGNGSASGWTALPPSMISRCSMQERLQKLAQNGGSGECESAVSKSLAWIKSRQNADGSWGTAHKSAMTGLALLCYLGRCEIPDSPFYGDNVMKGILYLTELTAKNPWGLIAEDPRQHASAYEHGIATYALGEMYALARLGTRELPGMREAFENGVRLIIENQLPDGGWGYGEGGDYCYRRNGAGDLSVTGWQYQALKAAKNTQLSIKGLHEAIDRAVRYLEGRQTRDGGFGSTSRDAGYNQWNLSGCGILGLQTLATGRSSSIKKGMRFARSFITDEPLDWNKNANLYCWYYFTQCFFQQGGEDWRFYNEQFLPQLLNNQNADGSWKEERSNSQIGSTSPAGPDRALYRQALCTLMLEVYYRYLKVADREGDSFFDR